ncbi:MAG: hypothetical protein HY401_08265 [Elusimicrobia bacterium]|nr:hypothetical protein [Elusimicrobiota bacterium]
MTKKRRVEHVLPASNPRFIEKAAQSDADILFLDLEDAVATSVKVATRQTLIDAVKTVNFQGKEVFVRPNNLRTKWSAGDYYFVVREIGNLVTGVTLPKIVGPEDIELVDRILTAIEKEKGWPIGGLKIEALIELPSALIQVEEIARLIRDSGRGGALIFGLVDYTAATGGRPQCQEDQFTYPIYAKKRIVEVAKKYGLDSVDGVTIHVKNYDRTKEDAILAAKLGFTAKWSLHPEQIRAILDANRERPFIPARPNQPRTLPANPFVLDELARLAKEERPLLVPLSVKFKASKARRSVWLDKENPAPAEIDQVARYTALQDAPSDAEIFLKIQTKRELQEAHKLAASCDRVAGLIYAIEDKDRYDFESRGALLAAASAADVDAIDGAAQKEGARGRGGEGAREKSIAEEEAICSATMGFSGKVATTVEEARLYNKIFSPPPEAIERALEVMELYHQADVERGLGAIVYLDKRKPNAQEELVDAATVKVERRVLAVAHKAKLFTPEQEKRFQTILERESGTGNRELNEPKKNFDASRFPLPASRIKRVSILGAGEIGAPLAARMARHGIEVALATLHLDTLAKAEKRIKASLEFRAKEASGIAALEKKLAKAEPAEKTALEAKVKELTPQMKELRDQWMANVRLHQDTNYLNVIKALNDHEPDFIIECIREELLTKQSVLEEWAKAVAAIGSRKSDYRPIFATTSSSLKVSEVGSALPTPMRGRFLNFHPFNPPDRLDLVEIAWAPETDPKVTAEVIEFSKTIGLEPVVLKDSPGLIVNRVLFAYLGEAVRLLEEGRASFEQIMKAALDFGYPLDPFRLIDLVGLDVTEAILANLHASWGHIEPPGVIFKTLLGQGRYGIKSRKGFLNYAVPESLNAEAIKFYASQLKVDERAILAIAKLGLPLETKSLDVMGQLGVTIEDAERLAGLLAGFKVTLDYDFLKLLVKLGAKLTQDVEDFDPLALPLVMANESARLVQEGVAAVADIDLAMDLGTRFPEAQGAGIRLASGVYAVGQEANREPLKTIYAKTKNPKRYAAGPFGWVLRCGLEEAVARLAALARCHGPLYEPCQFLKDLAWGQVPARQEDGRYRYIPYKRAYVKPKGAAGPATQVFEEGIVPTQRKLGAYQIRGRVLIADINANWKWGVRDYPIDLSKYHQETGTVGGSAGLVLVTEAGEELAQMGTIRPGDLGIMLSGKHDVITTEALGGSAQAHRSFRIHAYEAKDPLEGSYSQEVVLDWSQFVKVDEGAYSFDELGSIGLVYPTVQHACNVMNVKKDDLVLIEGAVGGTGAAGVMTAKSRNALVVGTVSSDERGEFAKKQYGLDAYIDRIKHDTDESYVNRVKEIAKELTGRKRLLDKALVYSGQGMFDRHFLAVREGDPMGADDFGGELSYFGAGETGFALEVTGTSSDTPIGVMFERIAKLRRERYRTPHMRHILILADKPDHELKETIEEAKSRRTDVIVAALNDETQAKVREWKLLQDKGWWHKAKTRDGIINLKTLGIPIEKMPEPPVILPDNPTAEQKKIYEDKQQAYQGYMRRCLIPFGKALGQIWGADSTGRPLNPDVNIVLLHGQTGENILNYLMFTGFFTVIVYPNDTSKMRLRWHAALGWMSQNSILFSKKAVLGTHYASPAESTSIVDWIMRGVIHPVATKAYYPGEIGQAQEAIGTGKNVVLIGAAKPNQRWLEEARLGQEVAPWIKALKNPSPAVRELAVLKLHEAGLDFASEAAARLGGAPFLPPPTVGLAVTPETFEAIWRAGGMPELAQVPEEHKAKEFSLHAERAHLDILTADGDGVIQKFVDRFGEGIQQMEFYVSDVAAATEILKAKGISLIYPETRPGANKTKVNFFLIELSEIKKVLLELVELTPGSYAELTSRKITDLDIRLFAKASGDRNPFHLDDAYAAKSRYGVRIAHGLLTAGVSLSRLEDLAPGYKIESFEVTKFTAAVKIGDTVHPRAEVVEKAGDTLKIKLTAANQKGEQLFESFAFISPVSGSQLSTQHSALSTSSNWARRWSGDVAAFSVKPAPAFKIGDQTILKAAPETQSLKISQDTLDAYQAIFGQNNPHLNFLASFGPLACASAFFAPGYILTGYKIAKLHRAMKPGDTLECRVKIASVETTKSGKTLIKIAIDVAAQNGEAILSGEVTKLLADIKEPGADAQKERIAKK